MKGVTTMHRKEEFVRGMGQRRRGIFVVIKDVPIRYRMEDYATDMVRKLRLAVLKDALIKLGMEGYVSDMVQSSSDAAMKDATTKYVLGMVQKSKEASCAPTKDAQTMPGKEEFV